MNASASATLDQPAVGGNFDDSVAVGIDELIIGRPIRSPIHDDNGMLLLASGAVITSEFKRLLRSHKLKEVHIHKDDVSLVTLSSQTVEQCGAFSFCTELTQQLDRIIEGGVVPVQNTGAALKESMVSLGRNAYDKHQRERLQESNRDNQNALNQMMKSALDGGVMDGAMASRVASTYLSEMRSDVENVLTSTVGVFDEDCLSGQALQTSLLAMALGIEMGFDLDNVKMLGLIGLVHDWGMMKVPQSIRNASHPLNSNQVLELKKHPIYSLEFLERARCMPGIVSLVAYQIHERPNGSGYPRGRTGNAIHQFARIVAVADAYTAMTTPRAWRRPFMAYAAVECLIRDANKRNFDPSAVKALLHVLSLFPIGSMVALTDGSVGRVLRRNGQKYTSPIVQILQNAAGRPLAADDPSQIVSLSQSPLKVQQALPTPGRDEMSLSEAIAVLDQDS